MLSLGGRQREIVKSRAQLLTAAATVTEFVGNKWGGEYLRALDIYHHILNKSNDNLVYLGDITTVKFSILTGDNEIFFLAPESIAKQVIEDNFRRPVMTTTRESCSLIVATVTLSKQVFCATRTRKV